MPKRQGGKDRSQTTPFTYHPLDLAKRQIRLVKIKPYNGRKKVSCSMVIVSLEENPDFEALSYVWGDAEATKSIFLDGSVVNVTVNLAAALKRLRSPSFERIIWVDALYVDQNNTNERNHQVNLMKDIYSNAAVVNVWVGEKSEQCGLALDTVKTMSENRDTHLDIYFEANICSPKSSEKRFKAVLAFFSRPWWQRVWTVQETVLARELIFYCGDRPIDGEVILTATGVFLNHMGSCCKKLMFSEGGFYRSTDLNGILYQLDHLQVLRQRDVAADLRAVMMAFRQRRCTDHRDKIYGYLGLIPVEDSSQLKPDYSISVSKTLETAALNFINKSQSLDILSCLEPGDTKGLGTASWLPTWTEYDDHLIAHNTHNQLMHLSAYNASRSRPLRLRLLQPGTALVQGISVDRISKVGPVTFPWPTHDNLFILDDWLHMAEQTQAQTSESNTVSPSIPFSDAFWLCLCNGLLKPINPSTSTNGIDLNAPQSRIDRPSTFPLFRSYYQRWRTNYFVSAMTGMPLQKIDFREVSFNVAFSNATVERSFFTTETGLMGTGPKGAKKGDLIVVLYGGKMCYILRPTGKDLEIEDFDGVRKNVPAYTILGDAYVVGLMDGHAIDACEDGKLEEQSFVLV